MKWLCVQCTQQQRPHAMLYVAKCEVKYYEYHLEHHEHHHHRRITNYHNKDTRPSKSIRQKR